MAQRKPVVQNITLARDNQLAEVDLRQGMDDGRLNTFPDNVVVVYQGSATLEGTETLSITGRALGSNLDLLGPEFLDAATLDDLTVDWSDGNITIDNATTLTLGTENDFTHVEIAGIIPGRTYRWAETVGFGTVAAPTTAIYDATNGAFIVQNYALTDGAETEIYFTAPVGCTTVNVYAVRKAGSTGTMTAGGFSLKEVQSVSMEINDIVVAASNVVKLDVSAESKCMKRLVFEASTLAANETITIAVLTW